MANWKLFEKPETLNEGLAEVQAELKDLQEQNTALASSVQELQTTNQRLYLKITAPLENEEPEKPMTSDDINDSLTKMLLGGK